MTKKIAIAASLVAFCSESVDAFGTKRTIDDVSVESKRTHAITTTQNDPEFNNHMNADVMKLILAETSMVVNPIHLAHVCKDWRTIMRQGEDFKPVLTFDKFNPFLE